MFVFTLLSLSCLNSWELGVMAEALTEYNWASYSVFSDAAFPPPGTLDNSSTLEDVLDIVNNVLAAKEPNTLTLFADESAGDPASAYNFYHCSISQARRVIPAAVIPAAGSAYIVSVMI